MNQTMTPLVEHLTQAADCLGFAVNDLTAANANASALASYAVVPLIAEAMRLRNSIRALVDALDAEGR